MHGSHKGPSLSATVSPGWDRLNLRLVTISSTADISSLYEVSVRQLPPKIDLQNTYGRHLLGNEVNNRFLKWMRTNYVRISNVTRLSTLTMFAMWAAPAGVSRVITPIAAVACLPIVVVSPLVMSADVLRMLYRHHEFWFFTFTSATNWIIAAILFNDTRVAGCVACFALNILSVMMDANFRTIILATRTGLAWIPAIVCIVLICVTKLVDIDPSRFKAVIPENKLGFTLANSFLNVNTTLAILVIRQTFRRRRVFTARFLHDRIIPCSTVNCDLALRQMRANDTGSADRLNTFLTKINKNAKDAALRRSSVVGGGETPLAGRISPTKAHTDDENPLTSTIQEINVIAPTLAFLDLRNALLPWMMPTCRVGLLTACFMYISGLVGLLLAGFTWILSLSEATRTAIPGVSLLCTAIFIAPFVASYQRDLLRALSRNFDFVFSSLQFNISFICLADMMHWDLRCLALASWNLWFHWILLWDALVPSLRERFRFKKIYGTPVLIGIMLGLLWIGYSLFFSSYDALQDRVLMEASWGSFQLTIRTSTFLIGRMTTILTWSIRLVWKAVRADEDDLIFIRGRVEYYTPLEFFPPVAAPPRTHLPPRLTRFLRLDAVVPASRPVKPPR